MLKDPQNHLVLVHMLRGIHMLEDHFHMLRVYHL